MKIALYLGSFNPFHNGHLECIKTALNDFKMDEVIIVPTMQNPWKEEKVLDIDKRSLIIINSLIKRKSIAFVPYTFEKDFEIYPHIIISNIEKRLIPPYYSYATLHALKNKYCNDEIFILCGEDTIKDIPNWMNGGEIIKDYDFLIVDRPRNSISSTQIREILRTRHKMDAYYSKEKLANYVPSYVIELLENYY